MKWLNHRYAGIKLSPVEDNLPTRLPGKQFFCYGDVLDIIRWSSVLVLSLKER